MLVVVIQGLALLIQGISALLALRLIRITGRYGAWLLIALSLSLIVARRLIAFGRLFPGDLSQPPDAAVLLESILLLMISVAQAAGILLIGPLFQSIKRAEEQLREVNVRVEREVRERTQELAEEQTELQATLAKLRELESLRDSLTHMIVHDLRTPLTSMHGFLKTLETSDATRLSEEGREYLQIAMESTQSLSDMVTSLLDVNKMESGRMELHITSWDLGAALRTILEGFGPLRGDRRLELTAPEGPVTLAADLRLITRVLQNLIANALRFTPEDAHILVGVEVHGSVLQVFVRDNGPGIPPAYQSRIFEKFGQVSGGTKAHLYSTGLGLAFCKLAVEAHGGRIWVDSEVGKGSTFWFELPVRQPQAVPSG